MLFSYQIRPIIPVVFKYDPSFLLLKIFLNAQFFLSGPQLFNLLLNLTCDIPLEDTKSCLFLSLLNDWGVLSQLWFLRNSPKAPFLLISLFPSFQARYRNCKTWRFCSGLALFSSWCFVSKFGLLLYQNLSLPTVLKTSSQHFCLILRSSFDEIQCQLCFDVGPSLSGTIHFSLIAPFNIRFPPTVSWFFDLFLPLAIKSGRTHGIALIILIVTYHSESLGNYA